MNKQEANLLLGGVGEALRGPFNMILWFFKTTIVGIANAEAAASRFKKNMSEQSGAIAEMFSEQQELQQQYAGSFLNEYELELQQAYNRQRLKATGLSVALVIAALLLLWFLSKMVK